MTGWLAVAASEIACVPAKMPIGTINVATLGNDFAMLTGNVLALFTSPLICVIISYIWPQNYDWAELGRVTESYLVEEDRHAHKEQVRARRKPHSCVFYAQTEAMHHDRKNRLENRLRSWHFWVVVWHVHVVC
jgi:hypothetical protein